MLKEIIVTQGSGEGPEEMSAFHDALRDAGISNYNLIKLSSIIPKQTKVVTEKISLNIEHTGNKLYVVLSSKIINEPGKIAWAGLGWIQSKDLDGIFAEKTGSSEEEVKYLIEKSLNAMGKASNVESTKIKSVIHGVKCEKYYACSVVCAVYKSEGWE